jgi:hypothetical protein
MIEHAIFFDNDQANIQNMKEFCETIECVRIPESSKVAAYVPFLDPRFVAYLGNVGPNAYFHLLREAMDSDMFDKVSGIQTRHVGILDDWMRRTAEIPNRAAIFDWDRTITMIEGCLSSASASTMKDTILGWLRNAQDSNPIYRRLYQRKIDRVQALPDCTAGDVLSYLVGGEIRLAMLRHMFSSCVSNKIHIVVLTNNTACAKPMFDELLGELFQDMPFLKICSHPLRGKSQYLKEHPLFQRICVDDIYVGGVSRRRKTRAEKGQSKRTLRRKRVSIS